MLKIENRNYWEGGKWQEITSENGLFARAALRVPSTIIPALYAPDCIKGFMQRIQLICLLEQAVLARGGLIRPAKRRLGISWTLSARKPSRRPPIGPCI